MERTGPKRTPPVVRVAPIVRNAPVILPAILSSVKSRADRSWSLGFSTRELAGEEASELMSMLQTEGHLLFSNTSGVEEKDVPGAKADAGLGKKTPSQRLHNVLYVLWEQNGSKGTFDTFYSNSMERLIDTIKEQLEPQR